MMGKMAAGLGDAVAKGKELAGVGGVPGKDKLDALSNSLTGTIEGEESPMLALKAVLDGGVPGGDAAAKAKEQLASFVQKLTDVLNDPKTLIPPGATCVASSWISSIKKKLEKLSGEVSDMGKKAVDAPAAVSKELNETKEKSEAVVKGITNAADVPKKALEKIQAGMSNPATLGDVIGEVESAFKDVVKTVKDALADLQTTITGVCAKILSMIQEIVDDMAQFLMRGPQKLTSAFKPPCCCCCLGAGKALDDLKESFETVANAIDLQVLSDGVKALKGKLEGLDLKPIKTTIEDAEKQMGEALTPAKEAAEKMGGGADKLRALGGEAQDAAPAAPIS